MKKKKFLILFLIFFISLVLRFYKLGANPVSLSWDEASIGYNAYSIAQTLKDEHGRFLPLDYFSAFGDYKPPVSIYLTAISVRLFGLSDWSVRFPFAFLGSLTVLLTFFLVSQLRRIFDTKIFSAEVSLLAAFCLAVSPWHTLLSRQAFEANIATFFIVLGILLFLKGLETGWWMVLGVVSLIVSIYTFNSPRVFVPLLMLGLVIFLYKKILSVKKWFLLSLVLGFLLLLPIIPHLFSPLGQLRFKEVNIFSDAKIVKQANARQEMDGETFLSKIVHNRRVGYFRSFLAHYFDHFNIDYLFFRGDINPKFSTRTTGQFFLVEVIFLTLGAFYLFSFEKKLGFFVLFWLFIGLVPAATARETPHALRTEISLPSWQIFSAFGIYYFFHIFKKIKPVLLTMILIFGMQFFSYLHNYYTHHPFDYSQDWQYGYKLAAKEIIPYKDKYDRILVSEKFGRPYIFFLTYHKYPPILFQKNQKTTIDGFGFYHTFGFGNYVFGAYKDVDYSKGKILFIGAEDEIPGSARKIKEIYNLNGEKSLEIAEIIN